MIGDLIALVFSEFGLLGFDDLVDKLFDLATDDADKMVVMHFPVQLEYGLNTLEMMTGNKPGGFELRQHTVYSRQPHLFALVTQRLVDILGPLMPDRGRVPQVKNLHPRQGTLQAGLFQITGVHISLQEQSKLVSRCILTLMRIISCMAMKNICFFRLKRTTFAMLALVWLPGACSWLPEPHKLDIEQGNAITQDEFESLYTGMSETEVMETVGAPMLINPFHADRWDYIYRLKPGKGRERESRFTLYFRDGILVKIDGEDYKEY